MSDKYKIPSNLKELTVRDYIKVIDILKQEGVDQNVINDNMVKYFCNINSTELFQMDILEYDNVIATLNKTLSEEPKFEAVFKHNDITFGFITKLEKMSVGEYADCDKYMSNPNNFHRLMSVLYRPINKIQKNGWFRKKKEILYGIENYQGSSKYCEMMLDVPAYYCIGALIFFWNLSRDLSITSTNYIQKQLEMEKCPKKKEILTVIMDGINLSTQALEETILNFKKSSTQI
jgi:hypothetical protein